ncbi:hypothetical protein PV433_11925 [Paenibacillus sp. GYB004]|uniref:hypothetical protein n=1 Tax=Paenibacillus sp. GYB004 TaxID=2994393 RepID=UPI002F9683FB
MTLTITEKEKRTLAAFVTERLDEVMRLFPFAKYPTEPLNEWRRIFCDPGAIPLEAVRQALAWHFGGWQRKDLALTHRKVITEVTKAWPEFVSIADQKPEQLFGFWQTKLTDWNHGFGAAAFFLHLQQPVSFEIADRHRIEAMYDLLGAISQEEKALPDLTFDNLLNYTNFFRSLLPKLSYGDDSPVLLDRFLKALGNRHAYKFVPADYKSTEPTIRSFSWDAAISNRFRLDQIVHRSNVDILFACFLLTLESEKLSHEGLTIAEVIDRLPLGTGGLCNPASFNYALVALFGGQKQRDYWVFQKPELSHSFTAQANQSTRNMRFYLSHASEKLSVNPKYVKEVN